MCMTKSTQLINLPSDKKIYAEEPAKSPESPPKKTRRNTIVLTVNFSCPDEDQINQIVRALTTLIDSS